MLGLESVGLRWHDVVHVDLRGGSRLIAKHGFVPKELAKIIVLLHRHPLIAWACVFRILALLALGLLDPFPGSLNFGFDFKHFSLFLQSSFLSFLFPLEAELLSVVELLLGGIGRAWFRRMASLSVRDDFGALVFSGPFRHTF